MPERFGDTRPPVAARKADSGAARLLTPNISEEAQPILAHNLANLGLWPTFVFHCSGQIGKIAECAHPRRVHDVAQKQFTQANIGNALVGREIARHLRELGTNTRGPAPLTKSDRSSFLSALDTAVQAALREAARS
jgi:hypothetical protein